MGLDIDFRHLGATTDPAVRERIARLVRYVVSLGANAVTLSFPYAMASPGANVVAKSRDTPSDGELRLAIADAHKAHLSVTLRPYLDQLALKKHGVQYWSGNIAPSKPAQWFASLQKLLRPYLTLAARNGISVFVLASELNSLEDAPYWTALITAAKKLFSGTLSYAQNWDRYASGQQSVAVPGVGLDAYPPVRLPSTASLSSLTEAWSQWLAKASPATRARTTIYEVGIPATSGAYALPYAWSLAGPYDETVQANWLAAACTASQAEGIPSFFFWGISSRQPFKSEGTKDRTSFYGRAAEESVRDCFLSTY